MFTSVFWYFKRHRKPGSYCTSGVALDDPFQRLPGDLLKFKVSNVALIIVEQRPLLNLITKYLTLL